MHAIRSDYEAIKGEIGDSKTAEEVRDYAEVFWERYGELEGTP